jgi:hypothetical protein
VPAPTDIDGLSFAALKALVLRLLNRVAEQDRLIAELRAENPRLKGLWPTADQTERHGTGE